jgi:hypothetical protein
MAEKFSPLIGRKGEKSSVLAKFIFTAIRSTVHKFDSRRSPEIPKFASITLTLP